MVSQRTLTPRTQVRILPCLLEERLEDWNFKKAQGLVFDVFWLAFMVVLFGGIIVHLVRWLW